MPEATDRAHSSPQGNDDLKLNLGSGGGERQAAGGNQPDPATLCVPAPAMCIPPACLSLGAIRNGCSVAPTAARWARRRERERARVLRYGPLERAATGILLCMALHWGVAVGRGQGENELRAVEAVAFTWWSPRTLPPSTLSSQHRTRSTYRESCWRIVVQPADEP